MTSFHQECNTGGLSDRLTSLQNQSQDNNNNNTGITVEFKLLTSFKLMCKLLDTEY